MKKLVRWLESSASDSRTFNLSLLALVAVFTMPPGLVTPLFCACALVSFYSVYKQIKLSPPPKTIDTPNEILTLLRKNPGILRTAYLYAVWLCINFVRNAASSLSGSGAPWTFQEWIAWSTVIVPMLLFVTIAPGAIQAWRPPASDSVGERKRIQRWTDATYTGFVATALASIIAVICTPGGIGAWVTGWLLACARDANLPFQSHSTAVFHLGRKFIVEMPVGEQFLAVVNFVLCFAAIVFLWPAINRLSGFLVAACKGANGKFTQLPEAFLRQFTAPRTTIKLKEAHPFIKNSVLTLGWLGFNYAFLFWLVGCSGGPIGQAIKNWLDACVADADTGMVYGASANPHLRMFCGAIFALYGTVPVSVMGSAFLPYARQRQLLLSPEGITFPDGPYLSLQLRPMRLWSDFKSVTIKSRRKNTADDRNATIRITFHTGGSLNIKVSQLKYPDLELLFSSIDEHASNCQVSDEVVSLRSRLRHVRGNWGKHDLNELGAQNFQSTVFVPHEPGSWLPNGECRVVRLLASRPLSCVYLVRTEAGKLAIAKQFFFADDTEETKAMRKCFEREYELLQQVKHKAIAQVLEVFHRDQSTYLLLEHAEGIDLRSLVEQSGVQSEESGIEWADQLCHIMTYLHSMDPPIVHRDLTPDNVVLAADGTVRVIDFGAAHQFMEGITGTIIGKQCYVAPEQLRGQAGPRSDVYSFGCMLYFLLTGREPIALTPCLIKDDDTISSELCELVALCTAFEESERPRSFWSIHQVLQAIKDKPALATLDIKELIESFTPSPQEPSDEITPDSAGGNECATEDGSASFSASEQTEEHHAECAANEGEAQSEGTAFGDDHSLILRLDTRQKEQVEA